jgi:CheY-like chemotaxis protein
MGVYCTTWTFYEGVGRAPIFDHLSGPNISDADWLVHLKKNDPHQQSKPDYLNSRFCCFKIWKKLLCRWIRNGYRRCRHFSLYLRELQQISSYCPEISIPTRIEAIPPFRDTAFFVALLLALFAILFRTRHLDAARYHQGLVAAIVFKPVVKRIAFFTVGFFQENHLNKAVWLFQLYLLLINIFILPNKIPSSPGTVPKHWKKTESFRPDMILPDVMMPEITGFKVRHRIRAKAESSILPGLLCSLPGTGA